MELDWFKIGFRLFFDRKIRLQLMGYRPEVICFVRSSNHDDRHLMITPGGDHSVWIPPQEGIEMNESVEQAALRCLEVELGLSKSEVHYRRSIWVGKRFLPPTRWGERDLQYSLRGLLGDSPMVGKAYYAALLIANTDATIQSNSAEIYRWEWVDKEEFQSRIKTNHPSKVEILRSAWSQIVGG